MHYTVTDANANIIREAKMQNMKEIHKCSAVKSDFTGRQRAGSGSVAPRHPSPPRGSAHICSSEQHQVQTANQLKSLDQHRHQQLKTNL